MAFEKKDRTTSSQSLPTDGLGSTKQLLEAARIKSSPRPKASPQRETNSAANAPSSSAKPPASVPAKPATPKTPVKTADQNQERPNYLKAFQRSVGDKQDPNVTAVGMDFGRYLGTLRGSNKSSKGIARATANGRHANSNAVATAYSTQGINMPAPVKALLDQLDNLASHSAAVAAMDDTVRVQMIGQGNKSLDATVIAAQEDAILQQLNELTGDVVNAEARLDFQKKQFQTAKSGVDLAAAELSYKAGVRDYNQEAMDQQASDWLEDTTEEELANAIRSGQLPDFVSIEAATIKVQDRIAKRSTTVTALANIDKTNRESMAAGVATFGTEALEALIGIGLQQKEEGNLFPSVQIPGSSQSIPLVVLEDALDKRRKIEAENGTFDIREYQDNSVMISALSQQAQVLRNNTAIDPLNPLNLSMQENLKLAVNATTPQEQKEAIANIQKDMAAIRTDALAGFGTEEEKDSFSQLNSRGRTTMGTAIPYLSTVSPDSVMAGVAGNETYTAIADALYLFADVALEEAELANEATGALAEATAALGTDAKKKPTVKGQMQAFLDNDETRARIADMALAQLNTEFYVAQLDGAFNQLGSDLLDPANREANPEQAAELTQILGQIRSTFFGNDVANPTGFSNVNNPDLVTNEVMQVLQTDENGDQVPAPVLRANGEAVRMKVTNPNYLLDQLGSFDIALKEAGYEGASLVSLFLDGDTTDAAGLVAERNMPRNLDQHQLANIAIPIYAKNPLASPAQVLAGAVTQQFEQLKQQRVYDYEAFDSRATLVDKATELNINFNGARSRLTKQLSSEIDPTDLRSADEVANRVANMSVEELLAAGALTQNEVLAAVTATQGNN